MQFNCNGMRGSFEMLLLGLVTRLYFVIAQKLTEIRVAVQIFPYPTPEKRLCYEVI